MRKFKLNGVDAWIIQSKHAMECNKLKDNYSSNLKSMSKTISPFLIKLTMTHKIEFVSSAAFVSVTSDVIWILVTSIFFSNLHMVRIIYMCMQPCKMEAFQCWWILNVRAPWVLQCFFFSCGNSLKGQNNFCYPVFSTIQQNRGNPTKASDN